MNGESSFNTEKSSKLSFRKFIRQNLLSLVIKIHQIHSLSNYISTSLENFLALISNKKIRFSYNKKENLFNVKEENNSIVFTNKIRGFWLYRNGINVRNDFLFKSYCLDKINFEANDTIIDCGANSGDLYHCFNTMQKSINYIGLEPNPEDYKVLKSNVVGSNKKLLNKGLGNKNEFLPFYISSDTGDSSFSKPITYTNIIEVEVITLEQIVKDFDLQKIKLLKVEAEGYEIEVLEGIGQSINHFEYISIDGGYERGTKGEQTFTWCSNFLLDNNFEMIDVYFNWSRALFKNKKLKV